MFNYRKLTDSVQVDFPTPRYLKSQQIHVNQRYNLVTPTNSRLISVYNHGGTKSVRINGTAKLLTGSVETFVNMEGDSFLFEYSNALLTVTYIIPE